MNFAWQHRNFWINSGRMAMSIREISLMHMWALYESEIWRSLGKWLQMFTLTRMSLKRRQTEGTVKYNSGVKFFKKNVCQNILLPDACWWCLLVFFDLSIRFKTRGFWSIPLDDVELFCRGHSNVHLASGFGRRCYSMQTTRRWISKIDDAWYLCLKYKREQCFISPPGSGPRGSQGGFPGNIQSAFYRRSNWIQREYAGSGNLKICDLDRFG